MPIISQNNLYYSQISMQIPNKEQHLKTTKFFQIIPQLIHNYSLSKDQFKSHSNNS
jgi:hypothetical protein